MIWVEHANSLRTLLREALYRQTANLNTGQSSRQDWRPNNGGSQANNVMNPPRSIRSSQNSSKQNAYSDVSVVKSGQLSKTPPTQTTPTSTNLSQNASNYRICLSSNYVCMQCQGVTFDAEDKLLGLCDRSSSRWASSPMCG